MVSTRMINNEGRSPEILRQQFEFEREQGERIKAADKNERRHLYETVYNELYRNFPDHCLVRLRHDEGRLRSKGREQYRMLEKFLRQDAVFLELGAGDCAASMEIAHHVAKVYAVEISDEMIGRQDMPGNLEMIMSDGSSIPLPDQSVDVAYSRHLMEHLHVDDAWDQLQEIYRVLKPGGHYVLLTPNRINGPWDISRPFQYEPAGLHIKEYSYGDLKDILNRTGFRKLRAYRRRLNLLLPLAPITLLENALLALPPATRQNVAVLEPISYLINICLVATK